MSSTIDTSTVTVHLLDAIHEHVTEERFNEDCWVAEGTTDTELLLHFNGKSFRISVSEIDLTG
jgi:hypothetical protein